MARFITSHSSSSSRAVAPSSSSSMRRFRLRCGPTLALMIDTIARLAGGRCEQYVDLWMGHMDMAKFKHRITADSNTLNITLTGCITNIPPGFAPSVSAASSPSVSVASPSPTPSSPLASGVGAVACSSCATCASCVVCASCSCSSPSSDKTGDGAVVIASSARHSHTAVRVEFFMIDVEQWK
uniref:Uncharacterized protein n=1 Tax=Anopheles melas TaxID=34690 RepID=A0A182TUM7_9DIPT